MVIKAAPFTKTKYEGEERTGEPTPTKQPSSWGRLSSEDYGKKLEKYVYEEVTKEKKPTELETLYERYMREALEKAIAGPSDAEKAFKDSLTEYQTKYLEFQKQQLKNLQEAKELGEITGDLNPEELEMLDTLEANAIEQLTTQVNKQLENVMGHEIASLVSRGVLQGAIGSETMSKLGEKSLEIIARGTTDIESTRISQELGMRESTKSRDLQLKALVQSGQLTREQAAQQMAISGMGLSQAQTQFETETALTGSQYSQALAQDWSLGKLNVATGMSGGQANRAMQMAIASQNRRASSKAAMWGAIGTGAGLALMSSREYKKDIEPITEKQENEMLNKIKNTNIYTYRYKSDDSEKFMGVVTEEAPKEVVTNDGKHLNIINYIGYLTSCIKTLAKEIEVLKKERSYA